MRVKPVPDDEVGPRLDHDPLLVHDVLLLPRLHDVVFLEDLQRVRLTVVRVEVNLQAEVDS